jgi:hypothetical protein
MLAEKRHLLWLVGLLSLVLSGLLQRFAGHVVSVDLVSSGLLALSVVASGVASLSSGLSNGGR